MSLVYPVLVIYGRLLMNKYYLSSKLRCSNNYAGSVVNMSRRSNWDKELYIQGKSYNYKNDIKQGFPFVFSFGIPDKKITTTRL